MSGADPSIQYARTSDGHSIAYWSVGSGPPLVLMPATPFTHVQAEWRLPQSRAWLQALQPGHTLIRYDARGFGLSDRDATDFTLEAQCRDLDAVVEALGLEQFALIGIGDGGMTAISYAGTHPERVTQLVLWCSWARRTDVSQDVRTRTLAGLVERDWEIYTETAARVILGWDHDDEARVFAAFYREAADPQVILRSLPMIYASDASPMLSNIQCPTLVMHRQSLPAVDISVARELAAGIRGAKLVLMDGNSPLPFSSDMDKIVATIHEFLGDAPSVAQPSAAARGAPVTILFTDMEGSTQLTQRLGDADAQRVLHVHNDVVRAALRTHGGHEIKHTGDGIMASFVAATSGLECAIDIQRQLSAQPEASTVRVRIGLNAGEPVAEEGDLFGTAVQLAARICNEAEGGQILVSGVVRDLAAGKGFLFSDRGTAALKGFEDAVRLFEARWAE